MRYPSVFRWRPSYPSWIPALGIMTAVVLLATIPTPLVPVARSYRDLCERYPVLTLLTGHLPPLPVALILSLAALALANGGATGVKRLVSTLRFNRRLERSARPIPPELSHVAERLGLEHRLTYLDHPAMVACCYGFLRPRIAMTAGLLSRLDQEELAAVLAHERHHLERRDPLRYLLLHALAAAAFMFPVTPAIRQRLEVQTELAADGAALAVASRGALAGALLAVLAGPETRSVGAAGLSATEARIAHLTGTPALPSIPASAVIVSLGLLAVIAGASADLTTSTHIVEMVCRLCS